MSPNTSSLSSSVVIMINTSINPVSMETDRYSDIQNVARRNANDIFQISYVAIEDVDSDRSQNSTGNSNYDITQSLYAQIFIVLMYVLIIVVAVGGNLLFAYIIVLRQKIWSVTNLFLLNLAVGDILKALICNPFSFVANVILLYWPYAEWMCPFVTYVQVVAVFLSAFTLVAMCIDRYLAIIRPMKHKMSKTSFAIIMCLIWVVSLLTSLPTVVTSKVQYQDNSSAGLCLEAFENEDHRSIYSVVIMVLQYFLPLAVITVTNVHIGFIVWIKKPPGEAEQDRDKRLAASKRRLLKMIIICVVIYAICWLPLHVITLIGDVNPDLYSTPHIHIVWIFAHWLAMSHSCYNPIVYFSLNANFRRNLKHLCLVCRNRQKRLRYNISIRLSKRRTSVYKHQFTRQCSIQSYDLGHVTKFKISSGSLGNRHSTYISTSPRSHYRDSF